MVDACSLARLRHALHTRAQMIPHHNFCLLNLFSNFIYFLLATHPMDECELCVCVCVCVDSGPSRVECMLEWAVHTFAWLPMQMNMQVRVAMINYDRLPVPSSWTCWLNIAIITAPCTLKRTGQYSSSARLDSVCLFVCLKV